MARAGHRESSEGRGKSNDRTLEQKESFRGGWRLEAFLGASLFFLFDSSAEAGSLPAPVAAGNGEHSMLCGVSAKAVRGYLQYNGVLALPDGLHRYIARDYPVTALSMASVGSKRMGAAATTVRGVFGLEARRGLANAFRLL